VQVSAVAGAVGYVNSSAVRKCPFAARSYLRTPQGEWAPGECRQGMAGL
jgi:hypothetical protein